MKYILTIILLIPLSGISQNNLDSLWNIWDNESKHDTLRLGAMTSFIWDGYLFSQPDSALIYSRMMLDYAKKKKRKKHIGNAYQLIGTAHLQTNEYDLALKNFELSLGIKKELSDHIGVSHSLNNIALVQENKGNFEKALELHMQSLEISKKQDYLKGIAMSLNNIGNLYFNKGIYNKAIAYHKEGLKLFEEEKDYHGLSSAYINVGRIYEDIGDLDSAIICYEKGLVIDKKLGYSYEISAKYNDIGRVYKKQGNFAKAIEIYSQGLKIAEKLNDKESCGALLNSLGAIYFEMKNYESAIKNFNNCLSVYQKISNKKGLAGAFLNLGLIYFEKKEFKRAMDYYSKSLNLFEEIGNSQGVSMIYNNLGNILQNEGNLTGAMEYHQKAFKIQSDVDNIHGMMSSLLNIANVHYRSKNYTETISYANKAMDLAEKLNDLIGLRDGAELLKDVYRKTGKFKESLEMYDLFIAIRDSIENIDNQKVVLRQEYKYEYEKNKSKDSIANAKEKEIRNAELDKKSAELKQQNAEIKAKQNQQIALFGGLGLVILFSIFLYKRFIITQKQKLIIEEKEKETQVQKMEIELKHKEITDSINYAKRIQEAILPSRYSLSENLKNGFVLYIPKDIVAGDFYWLEKYDDKIYVAAADCTGHGVPGAMVSVVCSNALSKALLEEGIIDTGKILDRTRELVIDRLSKSEENVRDGMDISLLCIDFKSNEIKWSGANNPIWIIRDGILNETKPDKQPIGKSETTKLFTTHTIEVKKNDTIYIFTDGFQDQFGGKDGKKFKAAKLKELLISIQTEEMNIQKEIIKESFDRFKGKLEQVDDICIIGIKI